MTAKKRELQTQLDGIKKQLSLKDVIETNEKRKADLLKEEKNLAQQKADLEGLEFTADTLVKEQMEETARRVNMLFKNITFTMFAEQINGGFKPDCIMRMNGTRYFDLNSAAKIQSGLEVINVLQEFNQIYAPIFIDNRESCTEIPPMNCQVINLYVDDSCDKLVVKNG